VLAKLREIEVDFASNRGTMPRQAGRLSSLRSVGRQSWVKKCSAKAGGYANRRAKLTSLFKPSAQARFLLLEVFN